MLPDVNKTSSTYQPNQPFGGIATGDTGTTPTAALPGSNGPLNMTGKQTMGSGTNDSSLTNSYLSALKSQQGATAAAQSLSGYTAPDPNPPTPALPQFTPEQQKQFQSLFGSMFGQPTGQIPGQPPTGPTTGLNAVTPATTPPALVAGDNSRFANDPFKTNINALR